MLRRDLRFSEAEIRDLQAAGVVPKPQGAHTEEGARDQRRKFRERLERERSELAAAVAVVAAVAAAAVEKPYTVAGQVTTTTWTTGQQLWALM